LRLCRFAVLSPKIIACYEDFPQRRLIICCIAELHSAQRRQMREIIAIAMSRRDAVAPKYAPGWSSGFSPLCAAS
jgi:hypothetical protein